MADEDDEEENSVKNMYQPIIVVIQQGSIFFLKLSAGKVCQMIYLL